MLRMSHLRMTACLPQFPAGCGKARLSHEDAYTLCSLAADLRVTQVVNGAKGIHVMLEKKLIGLRSL